jgi:hypothetical protein
LFGTVREEEGALASIWAGTRRGTEVGEGGDEDGMERRTKSERPWLGRHW